MTAPSGSEKVIRRLYQITSDHKQGFENQIMKLLDMGLDRFGLDIGIFAKIEKNDYVIQYCVTPVGLDMQPGNRFDFDATYCSITCLAQGPIALEHVGKHTKYAKHPAYQAFGLESYIGIPITLNDELYGTLNFSSPIPFPRKFLDIDIDALQLMASWIETELIRREQETQLKALNKMLKRQANYDTLTNIPNRRGMYSTLKKGLNRLSRTQGECIIAIIDIDYFKKLNDVYGHQKGDKALVAIASKIDRTLRDYEFVARIGGEEFLLWLPDTNFEGSAIAFQRIMDNIANVSITPDPITVSIGACHFRFGNKIPESFTNLIDELMAKADKALYQAKEQGRNRVVLYTETEQLND